MVKCVPRISREGIFGMCSRMEKLKKVEEIGKIGDMILGALSTGSEN